MLKKCSASMCGEKGVNWGLLTLRIAVGLVFIVAGYGKLFGAPGIEGFTGMLAGLGIPLPAFNAYLVGGIELFGGIAILLGLFTRVFAPLLAFIMLVAFVTVKKSIGAGQVDITLFAMTIALTLMGPGAYSVIKGRHCGANKTCDVDQHHEGDDHDHSSSQS